MIAAITQLVIRSPRAVLVGSVLLMLALGRGGIGGESHLNSGGFVSDEAESSRALTLLQDTFDRGGQILVFEIRTEGGANSEVARAKGAELTEGLRGDDRVTYVESLWDTPWAAPALRSEDGSTGLVVAGVRGSDNTGVENSHDLAAAFGGDSEGVTVRVGGDGVTYDSLNVRLKHDLLVAELVAIPITFIVLVWVFGGLVAAALPVVLGLCAIAGTTGILRAVAEFTDVSIFALNLTVAMGLALAIDYTLLVLSRYREEVTSGGDREAALQRAMSTAGRTVVYSAVTVGLSLLGLAVFPMYFMRSFVYAGIAVVAFTAFATLIVTPAMITLLGDRIDALSVHAVLRRPKRPQPPVGRGGWYRMTVTVLRHALPIGLTAIVVLIALGAPVLGMKLGYPDDRVLPPAAEARAVGDTLRDDFTQSVLTGTQIVLPESGTSPEAVDAVARYAGELSRIPGVGAVIGPDAVFVMGARAGAGDPQARRGDAVMLMASTSIPATDTANNELLDAMHAVPSPGPALFSSKAQHDRDAVHDIVSRVPLFLALVAATTIVLLFLLTGSLLLPVKALVMNVLAMSVEFGFLVWVFQDGHLGGLGTTATGSLVAIVPILMFCVVFGLSMDYEVFLLARIREFWDASPTKDRDANSHAVAAGIGQTGRVVTAAGLLMAVVFAALAASSVSIMRMLGLGLALAVVLDTTVIRMLLMPSFMKLIGVANWWAPRPFRVFHARFGIERNADPRLVRSAVTSVSGEVNTLPGGRS